MGIKLLNTYLRKYAPNALKLTYLSQLQRKKIAVDISIYMYKYSRTDTLLESIFNMCMKFKEYNIDAIFVFDGKTPKEKIKEKQRRSNEKKIAELEYNEIKNVMDTMGVDIHIDTMKQMEMNKKMEELKKKFVRITDENIHDVKEVITGCGLSYVVAPYEADVLCAYMTKHNMVYATMSEDMDMFVLGCGKVMRYFSLQYNNCVMYTLDTILYELNLNMMNFVQLCIYSGTDYSNHKTSFFDNMKVYKKHTQIIKNTSFYDFLESQHSLQDKSSATVDMEDLHYIEGMFTLPDNMPIVNDINIKNGDVDIRRIESVLKKELFVFV